MENSLDRQDRVVLCPNCEHPHAYTQLRHRWGVNDVGAWQIRCANCSTDFLVDVMNPDESHGGLEIIDRFDEGDNRPDLPSAVMMAVHNLPRSDYAPVFRVEEAPLYVCQATGDSLEAPALEALGSAFTGITAAYAAAENYLASKTAVDVRHAVMRVGVTCPCGTVHVASFFTRFLVGTGPRKIGEYFLADVTGASLTDRLEGLMSKSDIMDLLSKLLVRWRLTAERIIVASPFVGHPWDRADKSRTRWDWLMKQLDSEQAVLITRPATLTAFKKLDQDGIKWDDLKRFGLENRIISANTKKQDFHAKFFIGVGPDRCEVLSGSANILDGPSLENISFSDMSRARCEARYISPLKVALPDAAPRSRHFVEIRQNSSGDWIANTVTEPLPQPSSGSER
jgi:hypothetical protein